MADVEDFSSKNDADMIGTICLIFWQKHIVLMAIFYQKIGKNGQERISIFSFFPNFKLKLVVRAGCISQFRAFWLFSDFGGANSMVAQMPREESKFEDNP